MQPGSIAPAPSAASSTSAKAATVPDTASWQAALAQAGGQAPAATPAEDKPAAAKPGTKDVAATVSPALAVAEKTLLQQSKKPANVESVERAAQLPQKSTKDDKTTGTPVAAAVTQPVVDTAVATAPLGASPAASAPDTVHAAAAPAVAKLLPQIPSTTAPASLDDAAPATPQAEAAAATSGHAATPPGMVLPQLSTAALAQQATAPPAAPPIAAAVTPGVESVTSQAPAAIHTAASDVIHAAVASVSTAAGNKPSLASSGADTTIAPPAAGAKDNSADKQTTAIQPAVFAAVSVHEATVAQPSVPITVSATLPITQPSAAGLAAAVTALHQSGQSGAILRLDPPGLGDLSVHVALGQSGQVNVLFVPSTQSAATAIQNNLPSLGTALAQSGLSLGQAQVGGQFNQNAGQGGYQPQSTPAFAQTSTHFEQETSSPSGLSAYA